MGFYSKAKIVHEEKSYLIRLSTYPDRSADDFVDDTPVEVNYGEADDRKRQLGTKHHFYIHHRQYE